MKRELKREQTLQLLLDTTKRLIEEKGCVKTTFGDIMERSGLSKGAIFHYVNGKDELLSLVLQSSMEETDRRFFEAIDESRPNFQGPMDEIAADLHGLTEPGSVANRIFRYLLGRSEEPGVKEILGNFYSRTVQVSADWIKEGQKHSVIPSSVDADRTAELFVLLSMGMRMRSGVVDEPRHLTAEDVANFMRRTLQPESDNQGGGAR